VRPAADEVEREATLAQFGWRVHEVVMALGDEKALSSGA